MINKRIAVFILMCFAYTSQGLAQVKFQSNGIKVTLPENFITAKSTGFAAFNRDSTLQMAFHNACHENAKKVNGDYKLAAELCFDLQFTQLKSIYNATVEDKPRDTIVSKLKCRWSELYSTIKGKNYYFVYILIKGKKQYYAISYSGLLRNRTSDLITFRKILSSYKET